MFKHVENLIIFANSIKSNRFWTHPHRHLYNIRHYTMFPFIMVPITVVLPFCANRPSRTTSTHIVGYFTIAQFQFAAVAEFFFCHRPLIPRLAARPSENNHTSAPYIQQTHGAHFVTHSLFRPVETIDRMRHNLDSSTGSAVSQMLRTCSVSDFTHLPVCRTVDLWCALGSMTTARASSIHLQCAFSDRGHLMCGHRSNTISSRCNI